MTNETPNPIVIPLSKIKILLILLGSIAFVAGGLWLWFHAGEIRYRNPIYVKAVAGAAVGFFGLCGVFGLFKLFDSAPGLIVDEEGIIDNSSALAAGRIPWSDIRGFEIRTVQNQKLLTIEVHNPEKYVQRAHVLKRPLVAINARSFGGPIQISSNALKINLDELVRLLTEAHKKYRLQSA
jgi:hypothetical protein